MADEEEKFSSFAFYRPLLEKQIADLERAARILAEQQTKMYKQVALLSQRVLIISTAVGLGVGTAVNIGLRFL